MAIGQDTQSFKYGFNRRTKIGYMTVGGNMIGSKTVGETQTPIFVVVNCTQNHFLSINFNHRNQASYKAQDPENERILFEKPDSTLQEHFSIIPVIGWIKPSLIYDYEGNAVKSSITFLEPDVKEVLKDVVTYVTDMNEKGLVLDDFDINNLWLVDGTVKFYGVGLGKSINYPKPCASNERKKNFQDVKSLLLKLIPLEDSSPMEYKDLIKRLDAGFIGISHHFCLKSPRYILRFLINTGDTQEDHDMQLVNRMAISTLDYDMVKDWNLKLDAPGVQELQKYLTYRRGGEEEDDEKQTYMFQHKNKFLVPESLAKFVHDVAADVSNQEDENNIVKIQVLLLNAFPEALFQLHEYICRRYEAEKWFGTLSRNK